MSKGGGGVGGEYRRGKKERVKQIFMGVKMSNQSGNASCFSTSHFTNQGITFEVLYKG